MAQKNKDASGAPVLHEQAGNSPGHLEHSELLYMMHELSRLISTYFDQVMLEHQLTHAQWWAMMHVFEREGVTQTELATIMQMGRASTGKLLERLESKGWIERRADASDSRVRRVYLRGDAVPVFTVMQDAGAALFRDFLAGIPREEELSLLEGLRKIKANAERGLRL